MESLVPLKWRTSLNNDGKYFKAELYRLETGIVVALQSLEWPLQNVKLFVS